MGFALLKKRAMTLFESAPWITSISTEDEYSMALELMEELIEDYDANKPLIDVLSMSIETWEDESETFAVFNKKLLETHQGISALRVLMDQHELKTSDLPEIGSKSLVSKILNGHRNLTTEHIAALSKRFKVSPELFF